jgi:uncharacterized membrane protein YkvA (DUF1232 family)
MSDLQTRCLDTFPEWLRSLSTDATDLAAVLDDGAVPEAGRRHAASALNYLFKSLDLIPDGIEDLGFLDDAFVLRVAAKLAKDKGASHATLDRLATGSVLIEELLGKDFTRLATYVEGLVHGAARGRTAEEIVTDPGVRATFVGELQAWAKGYEAPTFARDEKNLVKLTSFLSAKLPT